VINGSPSNAGPALERRSLILGLGRPQERRLLATCRADPRLRILERCASAPEALDAISEAAVDVALLDEDLHLLDDQHLDHFERCGVPTLVIALEPHTEHWKQRQSLTVLSAEADPSEVLQAILDARIGRRPSRPHAIASEQPYVATSAIQRPAHLQVFAFWSGPGSPGRTTLAINWGVLLGWVARTVVVDLNLTAGAVSAQLDRSRPSQGGRGWVASGLLQIASANPDSAERWGHEIFRVTRPLGPLSPHADVLAGVLQPRLREGISADFVQKLIAQLRRHYTYVLHDLGDEPLGEPTRESAVSAAALRAADQVLVVCPPDGPGLHQTQMALAQGGAVLDRTRAGLVVNRYHPRYHHAELARIEEALELPVVGVLPVDYAAIQRALGEGRPVVCDSRSKLRKPLQELAERVHGGPVVSQPSPDTKSGSRWPRRMRAAAASISSAAVSSFGALGGSR
jgi:MinD-like ATPase involved in chromosome partitioning or flagellar assembly